MRRAVAQHPGRLLLDRRCHDVQRLAQGGDLEGLVGHGLGHPAAPLQHEQLAGVAVDGRSDREADDAGLVEQRPVGDPQRRQHRGDVQELVEQSHGRRVTSRVGDELVAGEGLGEPQGDGRADGHHPQGDGDPRGHLGGSGARRGVAVADEPDGFVGPLDAEGVERVLERRRHGVVVLRRADHERVGAGDQLAPPSGVGVHVATGRGLLRLVEERQVDHGQVGHGARRAERARTTGGGGGEPACHGRPAPPGARARDDHQHVPRDC